MKGASDPSPPPPLLPPVCHRTAIKSYCYYMLSHDELYWVYEILSNRFDQL